MHVTETVAEGLKREFKVVIPAQSFQERIETRLKDRQRSMRLPGFRPGKVPMTLVAKHWRQHVTGEELQSTIGDSSAQIVSERGLPLLRGAGLAAGRLGWSSAGPWIRFSY